MSARRRAWAWGLAVALLLVLLLKAFAFDVYRVDSGSMEPTIFGSPGRPEYVLVLYDRSPPERYELVVISRPGEEDPMVKRAIGLPGESVQISNGDVLVDGRRLARATGRPPPIPVFDDRTSDVADVFNRGPAETTRWTKEGDAWVVDATGLGRGDPAGAMFLATELTDDYFGPTHELVHGTHEVNDAIVECSVRIDAPGGVARLGLNEQGDTFWLELRTGEGSSLGQAILSRQVGADPPEELARVPDRLSVGEWQHVSFSNADNLLEVELAGRAALAVPYDANHFDPADHVHEGRSTQARVWLAGQGSRVRFRGIRVARDLYYTDRGEHGVDAPVPLGPDRIFVLGDNSGASRDSREWGSVALSDVVGRPVAVVWPLSEWRWLGRRAD